MEAFETKSRLLYQAMNGAYHPRESELAGLQSGSLRKHPFLLALRRWGRFARRNGCFRRLTVDVKPCPSSRIWCPDSQRESMSARATVRACMNSLAEMD